MLCVGDAFLHLETENYVFLQNSSNAICLCEDESSDFELDFAAAKHRCSLLLLDFSVVLHGVFRVRLSVSHSVLHVGQKAQPPLYTDYDKL